MRSFFFFSPGWNNPTHFAVPSVSKYPALVAFSQSRKYYVAHFLPPPPHDSGFVFRPFWRFRCGPPFFVLSLAPFFYALDHPPFQIKVSPHSPAYCGRFFSRLSASLICLFSLPSPLSHGRKALKPAFREHLVCAFSLTLKTQLHAPGQSPPFCFFSQKVNVSFLGLAPDPCFAEATKTSAFFRRGS